MTIKTCEYCNKPVVKGRRLCYTHRYRMSTYNDPNFYQRLSSKGPTPCSIKDCKDIAITRGWCRKHYKTWQRNGDPLSQYYETGHTGCRVKRCLNSHHAKGFCDKHHKQWLRGTLTQPLKKETP